MYAERDRGGGQREERERERERKREREEREREREREGGMGYTDINSYLFFTYSQEYDYGVVDVITSLAALMPE